MSDLIGWAGNIVVIIALIRMGKYTRDAFAIGALGEALWMVHALEVRDAPLVALCVLMFSIYVVNLIRYKNGTTHISA